MKKLTLKAAKQYGVVTKGNSKIHGSTFSTDPKRCHVGSKLVNVEGSTCNKCYALKLAKVYPSAAKSWADNLDLFRSAVDNDAILEWCEAIALQIDAISKNKVKKKVSGALFHRWFTAGDLDSVDMLRAFVKVAEMLPHIKFWLPTREKAIVSQYKAALGVVPANMVIRVSSAMVGTIPLLHPDNTSTVHKVNHTVWGFNCPAQKQGGNCGDCSKCWDTDTKNVSYELH
jgi:hypothetical protein